VRRRAAVMRRAGWICETPGCGRIAQQVHHVDGDPGNNAMTNLLGVCVPCHRALEAEKRA
jgi:hypothetical protein